MEGTSTRSPHANARTRKSHRKSRNGCLRCKQGRRKCDELKPKCSRCSRNGQECHYKKAPPEIKFFDEGAQKLQQPGSDDFQQVLHNLRISSPSCSMTSSGQPTPVSSSSPFAPPSPLPQFSDGDEIPTSLSRVERLNSRELDLLGHYLTHTCHSIAFDREDLYAMKVGIPNLAFNSKPVMNSILALAAICKCRDIMDLPALWSEGQAQVQELLVFADQHHTESLRQIQCYANDARYYDYVLANAALMVQYGSASHWIRIRLAQMADQCCALPTKLLPTHSQWISLIRAVHIAFAGLKNEQSDLPIDEWNLAVHPEDKFADSSYVYGEDALSPQAGPSDNTERLLLPIVSATADLALEQLEARARSILVTEEGRSIFLEAGSPDVQQPELQACLEAIRVLKGIYAEVIPSGSQPCKAPAAIESPTWNIFAFGQDNVPQGWLKGLLPWVRSYLARVTSLTQSRPPRRTTMAFLSRVPAQYLNLVQPTLDSLPVRNPGGANSELACAGAVQRLAMDIFAHWLVLVMLLDGVWWIGGIGAWELGRVVRAMQVTRDWWPESMYKVGVELGKQKRYH